MTPPARAAAAVEILDRILAGGPAEKELTNWARRSRFAGSKDRAAIRDIVFDGLRRRRSAAARGGGETGRGIVLGLLRERGEAPSDWFTGGTYALPPATDEELSATGPVTEAETLDVPDWLMTDLRRSLGEDYSPVLNELRARAPVTLRANIARMDRAAAQARLSEEGIETEPHPLCTTALRVTEGARKIRNSNAFIDGLVELQDAASQAAAAMIPVPEHGAILDYCAGGGGKALALAALGATIVAHDADPIRMRDIPERATRAKIGSKVTVVKRILEGERYPVVVLDVPCSGSGAWRRQPEAKWSLTPDRLDELKDVQAGLLRRAAALSSGAIAYLTCSLLRAENEEQVAQFVGDTHGWTIREERRFSPLEGGDGFYAAILVRESGA
ncbi:RsmB/NOP family class I SAM-dependent RNA methyltransferase [Roseicyclus sp. F158]|uniref:RsmB/NOP family class I SAM-dependent RNA methyltransferase n=1 Tax=Tropicimonas omnivorans TaxID=3075590 RepID=A0ABU3DKB8_9RHOB|nr:RsmB/NOP family class I SAM-dependent RNA methyltransferase [Roseicyclus sp. F158]MDT0684111.1 RsmB/NOP family class I SAM-dependent RNA methyltransferase [Roseicyclus sp. F158]